MADEGVRGAGTRRRHRRALALAGAIVIALGSAACGSAGTPPVVTPPVVTPPIVGPATAGGTGTTGAIPGSPGEDGGGTAPDVVDAARLAQARRDALRDGLIAYRPPSPMRQGDVQRVVVRASGVEQRGRLLAGFPATPPGQVATTSVDVGLTLSAELAGEGFVVTPIGTGDPFRPSLPSDVAEWQWDITPTESGSKHLTLIVRSYYGDLATPVAVRYVDAPIQVGVDLWYAASRTVSSPGWAATGVTVPVIATAAVALGRRRRRVREQQHAMTTAPAPTGSPARDDGQGYL